MEAKYASSDIPEIVSRTTTVNNAVPFRKGKRIVLQLNNVTFNICTFSLACDALSLQDVEGRALLGRLPHISMVRLLVIVLFYQACITLPY